MGYTLEAFVGRSALSEAARSREPVIVPAQLPQGFVLVPLTDEIHDSFPLSTTTPYPQLYKLSPALAEWAQKLSHRGAIAYLEAEFFGGTGTHAAIVWNGGQVTLGPLHTEARWNARELISPPIRENAFNRALRHLDVIVGDAGDEFDALGLGRHRSTDAWLKTAG
jgi:hypothetical protein